MPCRSSEEESQLPDASDPVTPTKSLRNHGALHDNTDAESSSAESDDDESEVEEPVAPKKRARVSAQYAIGSRGFITAVTRTSGPRPFGGAGM